MKTRTFIAVLAFAWATSATAQNALDFANVKRYSNDNAALTLPQKGEHRVVFLGNSITDNWPYMRVDFFKEHGYIGRGIGGQTSSQFLLRFRSDVVDLKPEVVVINAGTNDIAENTGDYSEDFTYGNIVSMCEIARANNIKVILTSVLPAKNFGWRPSVTDGMQKIRSLNARLMAYAKKQGITYADYFTVMLADDGQGMNPSYSPETVHPNERGYEVMEKLIVPIINKVIKKKN